MHSVTLRSYPGLSDNWKKKSIVIGFLYAIVWSIATWMVSQCLETSSKLVVRNTWSPPPFCPSRLWHQVIHVLPGKDVWASLPKREFAFPPPLLMTRTSILLHCCFHLLILVFPVCAPGHPHEFHSPAVSALPPLVCQLLSDFHLQNPALWIKVTNLFIITHRAM